MKPARKGTETVRNEPDMYTTKRSEGLLFETKEEGLKVSRMLQTGRYHYRLDSRWSDDNTTLLGYLLVETYRETWGLMNGRRQYRYNPTGHYLKSLS